MELNERQYALYNHLEAMGDKWTSQKEIALALIWYYPLFDEAKFHDSAARHIMTGDIRAINQSDEIQKVIISGSRGIKLANQDEFARYIKSQYSSVFRRLKRVREKERKGRMDGQSYIIGDAELAEINAFLNEF